MTSPGHAKRERLGDGQGCVGLAGAGTRNTKAMSNDTVGHHPLIVSLHHAVIGSALTSLFTRVTGCTVRDTYRICLCVCVCGGGYCRGGGGVVFVDVHQGNKRHRLAPEAMSYFSHTLNHCHCNCTYEKLQYPSHGRSLGDHVKYISTKEIQNIIMV